MAVKKYFFINQGIRNVIIAFSSVMLICIVAAYFIRDLWAALGAISSLLATFVFGYQAYLFRKTLKVQLFENKRRSAQWSVDFVFNVASARMKVFISRHERMMDRNMSGKMDLEYFSDFMDEISSIFEFTAKSIEERESRETCAWRLLPLFAIDDSVFIDNATKGDVLYNEDVRKKLPHIDIEKVKKIPEAHDKMLNTIKKLFPNNEDLYRQYEYCIFGEFFARFYQLKPTV